MLLLRIAMIVLGVIGFLLLAYAFVMVVEGVLA